jgi:hypothetical protein
MQRDGHERAFFSRQERDKEAGLAAALPGRIPSDVEQVEAKWNPLPQRRLAGYMDCLASNLRE